MCCNKQAAAALELFSGSGDIASIRAQVIHGSHSVLCVLFSHELVALQDTSINRTHSFIDWQQYLFFDSALALAGNSNPQTQCSMMCFTAVCFAKRWLLFLFSQYTWHEQRAQVDGSKP